MQLNNEISEAVSDANSRNSAWHYIFWAISGAVVIGVSLPTFLVCWNCGVRGPDVNIFRPHSDFDWLWLPQDWISLQYFATIGCGPGAVLIGLTLFALCKRWAAKDGMTPLRITRSGIVAGGMMAFINLPGYFVGYILPYRGPDGNVWRVLLLFAIAGGTSGAWIAWQAWRSVHPEEKLFPRFSLGTLMIVVFAWGVLLAVFAPK